MFIKGVVFLLSQLKSAGLASMVNPRVLWDADIDQFLFYRIIIVHLRNKIDEFSSTLLQNFTTIVGMAALLVLTLWILIQGFRIATGQSRDSMMALVVNAAKATFIVSAALALGTSGSYWNKLLATDMPAAITHLVTNDPDSSAEEQIDQSLAWMQVAFKAIDAVDVSGDQVVSDEKSRALLLTAIGSGGPALVAGAMLMLYQIAIALFMGLGPLFILCLLFDQTKQLFSRWLFYGIGTMFSMAVLAVMTSIAMEMVVGVAKATWEMTLAGKLLGENFESGITSQAMQQGGMGLLLTTLILTAPPMAAMFFNGTLGQFTAYSAIGAASGVGPHPGAQGQPPGSYGGGGGHVLPERNEIAIREGTPSNRVYTGSVPTTGTTADSFSPGRMAQAPIAVTGGGGQQSTGTPQTYTAPATPATSAPGSASTPVQTSGGPSGPNVAQTPGSSGQALGPGARGQGNKDPGNAG